MTFLINPYIHGGFNPLDIAGLVGWWDAQDAGSITHSSGEISQIDDKSVEGNHLTQTTAGLKPNNLIVLGRNMMHFDGGDRLGATDDPSLDFAGDFSIYVVFRTDDVNRGILVVKGTPSTLAVRYLIRINSADTNNGDMVFDIDDDTTATGVVSDDEEFNDDVVRVIACVRDGTNARMYNDGAEVTESPVDITGYGSLANAGNLAVGQFIEGGQELSGDIGELLIYDNALSTADRGSITNYLKNRWGVP